ncbi:MAG: hypothetical protein ACKUBY_01595 [Candidatus Moraniibacteriota bacterium]|jgi:hypothetical protein
MHPIAMEQKTGFTIHDISRYITQDLSATEHLLNDAGVIFLDTSSKQDEVALAEELLIKSLASQKKTMQFIAYCQLRRANGSATMHTHNALRSYRSNQANLAVIEEAKLLWL